MIVKLKLHSTVDLITNSSTTIFTNYGEETIDSAKKILEFFLKSIGSDKSVDDVFIVNAYPDEYIYHEYVKEMQRGEDEDEQLFETLLKIEINFDDNIRMTSDFINSKIDTVFKNIKEGISPPRWFEVLDRKVKQDADKYNSEESENEFYIVSKVPEYAPLVEELKRFLNSPEQDASYC